MRLPLAAATFALLLCISRGDEGWFGVLTKPEDSGSYQGVLDKSVDYSGPLGTSSQIANDSDILNVVKTVCSLIDGHQLNVLITGGTSRAAYSSVASVTRQFNMPVLSWDFPYIKYAQLFDKVYDVDKEKYGPLKPAREIFLRPPLHELIADVVLARGWQHTYFVYDDAEALYLMQAILVRLQNKTVGLTTFIPKRYERDNWHFFSELHGNASDTYHTAVLVISNPLRELQALNRLAASAQRTYSFHYLIASYRFTEMHLQQFKAGLMNITAFNFISKTTSEIEDEAGGVVNRDADLVGLALLSDAVKVLRLANKQMAEHASIESGQKLKPPRHKCRFIIGGNVPDMSAGHEFGSKLAAALLSVQTTGNSGLIRFDEKGVRVGNEVDVLQLTFSHKSIMKFDSELSEPFVMEKHLESDNQTFERTIDRYEGYVIDLIGKIAGVIPDFDLDLHIVKDGAFGSPSKSANGEWDGMIGELLRGEADLAISSLTNTRQRERVVDFSKPFLESGITIMIKKPEKKDFNPFAFMSPLSTWIWLAIFGFYIALSLLLFVECRFSPLEHSFKTLPSGREVLIDKFCFSNCLWFVFGAFVHQGVDICPRYCVGLAYVAVSVVIFLVSRTSHLEWRQAESSHGETTVSNDFDIYNCLWFTLAAFMQQGTDIVPRSISGRIASSAWWFFTMIIVSSYTANLAAFLTLEKIKTPIKNVEELAGQSIIKYGIQQGGSTAEFFRESSVKVYRKMWQYMDSHPDVFVEDYSRGIQRVRDGKERYAFLLESTTNEFTNSRKPCDTMRVGDKLNSVGYGVATPFGSPLKDEINLAILELQEKGELKALQLKWWYDKGECEQGRSDSHSESLNLSKVAGIFYILIGGMVVAMLCALGEYMYRARVEARRTPPRLFGETSKHPSISH